MNNFIRHTLCPLLAAFIWGTAFSMQSICGQYLPVFTVNAFRSLLASAVLFAVVLIFRRKVGDFKKLMLAGAICGTALFVAANLQQFGIVETSAGKSGFITALYIVLVPLIEMFFRKPAGARIWLAVAISVAGMFLLCVSDGFTVEIGDLALLACALMFAVQILAVDRFAPKFDNIALSAAQFLFAGLIALFFAIFFGERPTAGDFSACIWPLLYCAIFSSCIAYTLQIVSQKGGNPTVVSLIMSLESVFAVLGGFVLLGERMLPREWAGCALMVAAIVLAQLPEKASKQPRNV